MTLHLTHTMPKETTSATAALVKALAELHNVSALTPSNNDLLAYDLAVCLNAWCFEPDGSFNVTKARALFAGYARVRRLEASGAARPRTRFDWALVVVPPSLPSV